MQFIVDGFLWRRYVLLKKVNFELNECLQTELVERADQEQRPAEEIQAAIGGGGRLGSGREPRKRPKPPAPHLV
jgi:hypothetical protein